MKRFLHTIILTLIILIGGWALYHRHQISTIDDAWQLARSQLNFNTQSLPNPFSQASTSEFAQHPRFTSSGGSWTPPYPNRGAQNPTSIESAVVRVASFKLDSKNARGQLKQTADLCQQYDIVAIQNHSDLSIARLVSELNARGFDFRFVDREGLDRRLATIFNQQTIVLDEQHWYTVNDPENLFLFKPLVAWFRVRQAPPKLAFTFTLANVQLNSGHPDQEIVHLQPLFRSIRNDGRGEDDILIAGDFHSSDAQLKNLKAIDGLRSAIVGQATNTRNDQQLDNILFDDQATVEFTGNSGVFDFMTRFNMTLVEAESISDRMPIWAEYSVLEGHSPGRATPRY